MASGRTRERHLLTASVHHLRDDRQVAVSLPGTMLQLIVINLRNRPLSRSNIESMRDSILGLYHNLITGSRDFPVIPYSGVFRSCMVDTPIGYVEPEDKENAPSSSLMEGPAGLLGPAAILRNPTLPTRTPVLPERAELRLLMADRRNCIQRIDNDGRTVIRVISPVYRSSWNPLRNRWRVRDYSADGHTLMSVLCKFDKDFIQFLKRKKRKHAEGVRSSSSSLSLPKKRLRV